MGCGASKNYKTEEAKAVEGTPEPAKSTQPEKPAEPAEPAKEEKPADPAKEEKPAEPAEKPLEKLAESVEKPAEPAAQEGFDAAHVEAAYALDKSSINRSNIEFSRLSQSIAKHLYSTSPKLEDLEKKYTDLAAAWKSDSKPAFCCVEGVKYAIDALKFSLIKDEGHVMITVPFYCEFERGKPASEENPNGEDSPIQKIEEILFLLSFSKKISVDLIFVNDSIAEKQDNKDGGSVKLFKTSLLAYAGSKDIKLDFVKAEGAADEDFDSFTALDGQLCCKFTSCEAEASKGSACETPEEKRTRIENRGPDGKLRERKGGAVICGMETDIPTKFADKPQRVVRCLVDGDSAHPIGSFIGDAAYSILELGNTAYLGNLKHASTCVSIVGEDSGGGSAGTQARVQNRKLFFSGFIVPFLFPELTLKYKFTGTTQLPVKAFRGDIPFAETKLKTVQPNVDLGMLALLCSQLNSNGGTIDAGPVTIRDNIASSTMTTSDLEAEWTKTYGPIFTSSVGLCRELKSTEFAELPEWLTTFIESMELKHYTALFSDDALGNSDVVELFETMKTFRDASDRAAVLEKLKTSLDKIFA